MWGNGQHLGNNGSGGPADNRLQTATGDQSNDHHNDNDDQNQVNQTSANMERKS